LEELERLQMPEEEEDLGFFRDYEYDPLQDYIEEYDEILDEVYKQYEYGDDEIPDDEYPW
jgi:hypothetical protein